MDWFQRWPKDALIAVADYFLKAFDIVATAETKQNLIEVMSNIQDGVADGCVEYFNRFIQFSHFFYILYSVCLFRAISQSPISTSPGKGSG